MSVRLPNKKIVAVLPAYHAVKTLKRTIDSIPMDWVDEIILVDDASSDGTANLARTLGIKTVVHSTNKGYGGNQKTCYREALATGADVAVMVHPDFQYDPTFIPDLVTLIAEGKADAVFGSRMLTPGGARKGGMPLWKYVANIALTKIGNAVLGLRLSEYHSGFRAYSKKVLETLPLEANSNNFVFDTQIIAQLTYFKFSIFEVPITTRYFPEASMIGFFKSVEYGLSFLAVLCSYVFQTLKVRNNSIFSSIVKVRCRGCGEAYAREVYKATPDWQTEDREKKAYRITDTERSHGPIFHCIKCGLLFVPQEAMPDLSRMYDGQALDTEYIREEYGRRVQARKIMKRLSSFVPSGKLLDIGSGPGFFLDEARKMGFDVTGIETGQVWVAYAKEKIGLPTIHHGGLEQFAKYPDNHFSVISAWDVIEHVEDPIKFIQAMYAKLAPGGIFMLSTPLLSSLASRLLGEKWHAVIPSHVSYFTETALMSFLNQAGFTVRDQRTYTRFFSLQYLFNRLYKRNGESFLRNVVVPVTFFDEIEVYAQK